MTTTGAAPPRMIWARLAVDPLAEPLAGWLARRSAVTPNRVTALALSLAVGAAVCFAIGQLRLGGLLFLLRYFFDCVDGMVARRQGSSSTRGAVFDLTADVLGLHLVAGALAWHLVDSGDLRVAWGVGLLAVLGFHNWALGQRKQVAAQADRGDGGSNHGWQPDLPGLRQWTAFARRINMAAFPWVLEVEMTVFGLGPLLLPGAWLPAIVVGGTIAYLVVALVNLRRTWRVAVQLDAGRTNTAHPVVGGEGHE